MSVIFILVLLGVVMVSAFVAVYFWALMTGQFDDLDSAAAKILFEDKAIHKTLRENLK